MTPHAKHTVSAMRAISPFVIFAVFDVQVLKCRHQQVYKLMFCTLYLSYWQLSK